LTKPTLIGLILSLALSSTAAVAHARLQSSVPAADSQLTAAPASLTLNFSEKAQLAVLKLTLSGAAIPVAVDRTAAASSSVVVALPALKPGKYEVRWTALAADDGHMTKGTFSFSITGS
jgi:methionine-rich copper-binding protein CopC